MYMIYMYMYLSRSQAIGAVAIGLGIWVLVEEPDVLELSSLRELTVMDQSYLLTSVYLIITAGAAILVFGIVGMVATNAQSACCLGFSDQHLDEAIYRNIKTEYDGSPESQNYFSKHINAVHATLSCCGYRNVSDFQQSLTWNRTLGDGSSAQVPLSCCLPQSNSSIQSTGGKMDCRKTPDVTNSYTDPCMPKVRELFRKYEIIVIACTATLAFCQLLMLVLVLILMCSIVQDETQYDFKQNMYT
uniref:Tetraspanin n=1 Tax=Magallana gigas TaxID=29159 RepID=K1R9W1_MAGGI